MVLPGLARADGGSRRRPRIMSHLVADGNWLSTMAVRRPRYPQVLAGADPAPADPGA